MAIARQKTLPAEAAGQLSTVGDVDNQDHPVALKHTPSCTCTTTAQARHTLHFIQCEFKQCLRVST